MKLRDVLIIVGVVVAAAFGTTYCYNKNADEWELRVREVVAASEQLEERAEAAEARADAAEDVAELLAEQAAERQPIIVERIDSVRVETPPELADHPAIVIRDQIIDSLVVQTGRWKGAYEEQLRASAELKVANGHLHTAVDSLQAVLEDRPKKRPWFVPRIGVGPSVGISKDGEPVVVVAGVNLTWEIGAP